MSSYILNDPSDSVSEFLSSLVTVHSGLLKLQDHDVVLRKDLSNITGKVALISGGGAGHEPAHAGFVGKGMLTGAVSGKIFTSPPPVSIMAAIRAVNQFNPSGIILIVKDYTGDRLNFGLAKTWAQLEDIKVEMILVGEDCSQMDNEDLIHPRGLAGVVLIHKIAGAMSEKGYSCEEIIGNLRRCAKAMRTIGLCTKQNLLPGQTKPNFPLAEGEMAVGMGIHGEAGVCTRSIGKSSEIAHLLLNRLEGPGDFFQSRDEVVLLVNNIGGASDLEIGVLCNDIFQELEKRKIISVRSYMGRYLTSMQMIGVSVTIMKLTNGSKDYILSLLDQPCYVPQSLHCVRMDKSEDEPFLLADNPESKKPIIKGPHVSEKTELLLQKCLRRASDALISEQSTLNQYDSIGGDGDCGATHTRGASAILNLDLEELTKFPSLLFKEISHVCSRSMGGSSGAIYSIFFMKFASVIATSESFDNAWIQAFKDSYESVKEHTGTKVGDRTLVDVLEPISKYLVDVFKPVNDSTKTISKEDLSTLKTICDDAVVKTTTMKAKAGRASYVDQKLLKYPDPGAYAVSLIIKTCCEVFEMAM